MTPAARASARPHAAGELSRADWPLRFALPEMDALPTAPGIARAHVRGVLAEWELTRFEDDAVLIASELVTNVVRQATSEDGSPVYVGGRLPVVQVRVYSDRARLHIDVYDQFPGVPVRKPFPAADAEAGRGLALTATLGTWDWEPAPGGKVVSAVLAAAA